MNYYNKRINQFEMYIIKAIEPFFIEKDKDFWMAVSNIGHYADQVLELIGKQDFVYTNNPFFKKGSNYEKDC